MYPFNIGIIDSVQIPPFSPASLPGLVDWWTASSGVSTSGSNVTNWTGYNGNILTKNGNYSPNPTYNPSDPNYNNMGSITFPSTSMYMSSTYSGVVNPTMIVIGNIGNTAAQYNGVVGLSQVPGFNSFDRAGRISMFNKDANYINVFSDPPNSERNMSATNWKSGLFYFEYGFNNASNVLSAYSNNGFINQDTNMNYNGTFSGAPADINACNILYVSEYGANIGGNGTNTYTDVIFVDRILSATERAEIIDWAQVRYAL